MHLGKDVCHSVQSAPSFCVCIRIQCVRWCDMRALIVSGVYAVHVVGPLIGQWNLKHVSIPCWIKSKISPFHSNCAFVYKSTTYYVQHHPHPHHSDSLCVLVVGGYLLDYRVVKTPVEIGDWSQWNFNAAEYKYSNNNFRFSINSSEILQEQGHPHTDTMGLSLSLCTNCRKCRRMRRGRESEEQKQIANPFWLKWHGKSWIFSQFLILSFSVDCHSQTHIEHIAESHIYVRINFDWEIVNMNELIELCMKLIKQL